MRVTNRVKEGPETTGTETQSHAPRKMTFAENASLTIKILGCFGLLGAALWGMSVLKSAQ